MVFKQARNCVVVILNNFAYCLRQYVNYYTALNRF